MWEDSLFSTPSPAFIVCRHFNDDHFPVGSVVKNPPANAGDIGSIPGSGRASEKEMATQSGILALEIPWTQEPGWESDIT